MGATRKNPKKSADANGRKTFVPNNAPDKFFYTEAKALAYETSSGGAKASAEPSAKARISAFDKKLIARLEKQNPLQRDHFSSIVLRSNPRDYEARYAALAAMAAPGSGASASERAQALKHMAKIKPSFNDWQESPSLGRRGGLPRPANRSGRTGAAHPLFPYRDSFTDVYEGWNLQLNTKWPGILLSIVAGDGKYSVPRSRQISPLDYDAYEIALVHFPDDERIKFFNPRTGKSRCDKQILEDVPLDMQDALGGYWSPYDDVAEYVTLLDLERVLSHCGINSAIRLPSGALVSKWLWDTGKETEELLRDNPKKSEEKRRYEEAQARFYKLQKARFAEPLPSLYVSAEQDEAIFKAYEAMAAALTALERSRQDKRRARDVRKKA